ncbi:hypothetical protein TNCV_1066251 [Trichonephila clavipes]|nr:hypothetical protein TNCV_1066251 [Trichonephila clavipes]
MVHASFSSEIPSLLTSKDAGLTPLAEGLLNISKYAGYLPDIACYDGNPRNQGLVGVDRVSYTRIFIWSQRRTSRQERSGERTGQFTRPPRSIHCPGYAVSNALRTSFLKCTGTPSEELYIIACS